MWAFGRCVQNDSETFLTPPKLDSFPPSRLTLSQILPLGLSYHRSSFQLSSAHPCNNNKSNHPLMTTTHNNSHLSIIIIGASGDLAKKKTYPSLLSLYAGNLLPTQLVIYGYARSPLTDKQLRDQLRPYLFSSKNTIAESKVEDFLNLCYYKSGTGYGDLDSWKELDTILTSEKHITTAGGQQLQLNRLFYFAIPPNVFAETGAAIKSACMSSNGGFNRMIVEKPFGKDLDGCKEILENLGRHFDENDLFRIDHYLGKEMVQNLLVMRFGNIWMENMWNRNYVQCVVLTFKEPFGTQGRGGYFDQYGIIRDVIQNHLLQGKFVLFFFFFPFFCFFVLSILNLTLHYMYSC